MPRGSRSPDAHWPLCSLPCRSCWDPSPYGLAAARAWAGPRCSSSGPIKAVPSPPSSPNSLSACFSPQVPRLVAELAELLNGPCEQRIVLASMAHLNLVMIHPFRDGNGRMARCLQSLVLARGGVLAPVFMSIEEYLGRNTQQYYDVLAEVGRGSWHPESSARPWVRFTLTAHLRQARTMLVRVREAERLWVSIEQLIRERGFPERVMPLLFDAAFGLRVRNATYRAALEDAGDEPISEQTASRDLQRLCRR
ncbi:MAG: Fic family protein [Streptosporangiaceae bacterium]